MSAEFDEIAKLLLKLGTDELGEVKARAALLAQSAGAKRSTASAVPASAPPGSAEDADIELVLSEIVGHLLSEGAEYASAKQLRGTLNFKSFAPKVAPVMKYFRRATTNRVKLRALIRMSIRLLYKDLAQMNVSVSTRTLMNHWHRIPAVINRSFPGYARAGHLGMLVNSGAVDLGYVSEASERRENVRDKSDHQKHGRSRRSHASGQ